MENGIPLNSEINDIRTDFKCFSFSKFKKTDVQKQLIINLSKGRIEPACYWVAELICAGHYMDIWETILKFVGKYIHLGNPKIVVYLEARYSVFRNIMQQGHYTSELQLRNNPTIRKMFAEIICILACSNRKHSFETIKINRQEEFDITQMTERFKAPSVSFAEPIFKEKDPKELYIPINEFAYQIGGDKPNMLNACYWIEWVIEFDVICKKRKDGFKCERRDYPIDNKLQFDTIWLIWDCLKHYCGVRGNPYLKKLMDALCSLFCIKYTSGASKKRKYLLYFAVALLTEMVPTNIELTTKKDIIEIVLTKIHEVYKQIKKNEESAGTDYLFSNLERQSNFEDSVKKMEMMNSLDFLS